jgi:hypothetical protein
MSIRAKSAPEALLRPLRRVLLGGGTLSPAWFGCFAGLAEREGAQYSYRSHLQFGKAQRIYGRRLQQSERREAPEAGMPARLGRRVRGTAGRYEDEAYDGLGPYALEDLVAWERDGVELPAPERSLHQELTEAQIAAWDARVEAWAAARGFSLALEPAAEIRPWGYAMEIEGALVWTDDWG